MEKNKDQENKLATQKDSTNLFPTIQITTPSDLVKAKPISIAIRGVEDGENKVLETMVLAITKCAFALGVNMKAGMINLLARDILEVYRNESLEDIVYTLKMARQGVYDFGFQKRGVINMLVFKEWMNKTLEQKSMARERNHELLKNNEGNAEDVQKALYDKYKNNQISYEDYKKSFYDGYKERMRQQQIENKKKSKEESEYKKFKINVLKNPNHGKATIHVCKLCGLVPKDEKNCLKEGCNYEEEKKIELKIE